jgi:cytochrome c-type biogenesis protein CcsB
MMNRIRYCLLCTMAVFVAGFGAVGVRAQTATQNQQNPHAQQETQAQEDTHDHRNITPRVNFLSEPARDVLKRLMVQDFRGRMKPLDTLTREALWKISKKGSLEGWDPLDLYLSWMAHADYWFEQPIIAVRNPQLRSLLGVSPGKKRVSPASLYDDAGHYSLTDEVEEAQRTPDKHKSKVQRKLISLDERFNVFFMTIRGITLRVFPLPDDENNRWLAVSDLEDEPMAEDARQEYQTAFNELYHGLQDQNSESVLQAARTIEAFQIKYGAEVLPSKTALNAEMQLNRLQPFIWATIPYIIAFMLLVLAYAMSLARHHIAAISFRNPVYTLGMLVFVATLLYHAYGYVLRWIASGRAPLSNGYESLVFIALMIGVAGLYYEIRSRRGSIAALSALLTSVILGVAMLPTFDAAITPLVPVLSSYWLIIHVTIITASYGYLGLSAVIAMTMLVLHLFKRPGRMTLQLAIHELSRLNWNVMITGLAFLSVGTFLGGVWANESWGRYWGWDPKETWALVTILVYAFIAHFRFVESLNRPINLAAGSFLGISSVGMTYFGVNYFLSGLHSYAQGDAPGVPGWVYIMAAVMMALVFVAYLVDSSQSWERPGKTTRRQGEEEAVSPAT